MKIAQIAPLYESVPPATYGGTERVVAYLTDALVDAGHDVTLFASADSLTKAKLVPCCPRSLRTDPACIDPVARHVLQIQEVVERAAEFDIVHFHIDYMHFPLTGKQAFPYVTTLHGRLDIADLQPLYNKFNKQPVVSISYSQRLPLPQAYWVGNVYHGLPMNLYKQGKGDGGYLAFIGRISPEKGVDRAIEIAIKAGKKLRIAAKVDRADERYFESDIKHLLAHPLIEFIGEVDEVNKSALLEGAECLLFPIDWPEPFGMVMIEAMACGTPVLAFGRGSVPEVITDGVSGFIVESVEEALAKLPSVIRMSRQQVRAHFETRFSAGRMAQDYLKVYLKQINASRTISVQLGQSRQNPAKESSQGYREDQPVSRSII
ncbi:MAG: glycosyltransferase family 4 protein [Pseudomonadota bacterium]